VIGDAEDVEAAGGVRTLVIRERVRRIVGPMGVVVQVDEHPAVRCIHRRLSSD
jgi:hypothetical protein